VCNGGGGCTQRGRGRGGYDEEGKACRGAELVCDGCERFIKRCSVDKCCQSELSFFFSRVVDRQACCNLCCCRLCVCVERERQGVRLVTGQYQLMCSGRKSPKSGRQTTNTDNKTRERKQKKKRTFCG
jgi:hypothetical protein